MIDLGMKVRDRITKFYGTATARVVYLTRSPRILIEAAVTAEGKTFKLWVDEKRIDIIYEDGTTSADDPSA